MTPTIVDKKDPAAMFDGFANDGAWWGNRSPHLDGLRNGFEKWLATEWLLWMRAAALAGVADGSVYDRAGIEAKARLSPDTKYGDTKGLKQVDVWWTVADADAGPWDFVELKVVFNNDNAGKVFKSAGWDLWYLSRLVADENAHAAAVIVVGSGFDDADWKTGIATVTRESGDVAPPGTGGMLGTLRWQSWVRTFA